MSATLTLENVARHLRADLDGRDGKQGKKYVLLYAYNGTGKTRLSMAFKDFNQRFHSDKRDTLYFNAFTEDLFGWENDLENDRDRFLKLNRNSRFFDGLDEFEIETRIRSLLNRYADFDFHINTKKWTVRFSRENVQVGNNVDRKDESEERPPSSIHDSSEATNISENIKVSRGEENMFIWCFFLAIVELAMDSDIEAYRWVRYVYIDDPISSLDENNAVAVAHHLAQLLKREDNRLKAVISSHHTLFFNVCYNELGRAKTYFLSRGAEREVYHLKDTGDTPFFYHVALLTELHRAAQTDNLFTYHFSMLRTVLEKAASFHGFDSWSKCIQQQADDPDGVLHARLINIMNHGNYSLYEPREMLPENRAYFRRILENFLSNYKFEEKLFSAVSEEASERADA